MDWQIKTYTETELVAVKTVISLSYSVDVTKLLKEIKIIMSFEHPNVDWSVLRQRCSINRRGLP